MSPAAAIAEGDTPDDAEAARDTCLKSVRVPCGGFPEETPRSAGCTAVYTRPEDLLQRYGDPPLAERPS